MIGSSWMEACKAKYRLIVGDLKCLNDGDMIMTVIVADIC